MDFIKRYIAEEISKKEWDNDTDEIKTYFYKTFNENLYSKMKPLVEQLFTNINAGKLPEDELVFISPLSFKTDKIDDTTFTLYDKLIHTALVNSGISYVGMNNEKGIRDYLRNVYYKNGEKANLIKFLSSRFDSTYITKCIFSALWKKETHQRQAFMERVNISLNDQVFSGLGNYNICRLYAPFAGEKTVSYNPLNLIEKNADMLSRIPDEHTRFIENIFDFPVRRETAKRMFKTNKKGDLYTIDPDFDKLYPAIRDKYLIGFSYDHRWIASQSTRQGWSSCMNFMHRITHEYVDNSRFVGSGASAGSFIAYLFDKDNIEKDNKRPTARILFKPYFSEDSIKKIETIGIHNTSDTVDGKYTPTWDDVIWVSDKVYHGDITPPEWFSTIAEQVVNKAQGVKKKLSRFKIPENLMYRDIAPAYIEISTKDINALTKKIKEDPKLFSEQKPATRKHLLIAHPELVQDDTIASEITKDPRLFGDICTYMETVREIKELRKMSKLMSVIESKIKESSGDELIDFIASAKPNELHSRCKLVGDKVTSLFPDIIKEAKKDKSKNMEDFLHTITNIVFSRMVINDVGAISDFVEKNFDEDGFHISAWLLSVHHSKHIHIKNKAVAKKILLSSPFDGVYKITVFENKGSSTSSSFFLNVAQNLDRLYNDADYSVAFSVNFITQLFNTWAIAHGNDQTSVKVIGTLLHIAYKTKTTYRALAAEFCRHQSYGGNFLVGIYDYVRVLAHSGDVNIDGADDKFYYYLESLCDEIKDHTKQLVMTQHDDVDDHHYDFTAKEIKNELEEGDEQGIEYACEDIINICVNVARKKSLLSAALFFASIFPVYGTQDIDKQVSQIFISKLDKKTKPIFSNIIGIGTFNNASFNPFLNSPLWRPLVYAFIESKIEEYGEFFPWDGFSRSIAGVINPFKKYEKTTWGKVQSAICERQMFSAKEYIPVDVYRSVACKEGDDDYLLLAKKVISGASLIGCSVKEAYIPMMITVDSKLNGFTMVPSWRNLTPEPIKVGSIKTSKQRYELASKSLQTWKEKTEANLNKFHEEWVQPWK